MIPPKRIEPLKGFRLSPGMLPRVADDERIEALDDEKRALELIKLSHVSGGAVELRLAEDVVKPGTFTAAPKTFDEVVEFSSTENLADLREGQTVLLLFTVFHEFYSFSAKIKNIEGQHAALSGIEHFVKIRQRLLDRLTLDEHEQFEIAVREITGKRHLKGKVVDLSPQGLGVEVYFEGKVDESRALGFDQDILIEATIPGYVRDAKVPGNVVHWMPMEKGGGVKLGLSCRVPLALGEEHSLEDFLLERKYANVSRAVTSEDYQEIWRLLNLSFETIDAKPDEVRKASSIITWQKASWAPQPINRLYLLNGNKNEHGKSESIGTIATSRFYSKTWLIHQLGVDGSKGQVLSHQLYGRVLDYLRQTNEAKYTIGTWGKSARVFQRYYVDFIKSDPNQDYHYLEEANIYEFDIKKSVEDLRSFVSNRDITVGIASGAHEQQIMDYLESKYPSVYLEGLDLRRFDMKLSDVSNMYEKVALKRGRKVLSAIDNSGKLLGFALAEWGSEDQNVFSLFDNFRMYVLPEAMNQSLNVKHALLKGVMDVYASQDVRIAITWSTDADLLRLIPSGHMFYEVYLWVANAVRMKAFLRHLDRLHGRTNALRIARAKRHARRQYS